MSDSGPPDVRLEPSWKSRIGDWFGREDMRALAAFLRQRKAAGATVYPPGPQIFAAFDATPFDAVKVVILGQDPYHGPGQAHGLCFSVPEGVRVPPSLANIYKELRDDLGVAVPPHGNLEHWARQGVLLLNNALTVEAGQAGSHQNKGWEAITDAAVAAVAERAEPSVFILWGSHARKKAERIPQLSAGGRHLILASAHPSPLSAHAGFFGSRPFSKANAFLTAQGRGPIDW